MPTALARILWGFVTKYPDQVCQWGAGIGLHRPAIDGPETLHCCQGLPASLSNTTR